MNMHTMEPFVELMTLPGRWDLSILSRQALSASFDRSYHETDCSGGALRTGRRLAAQDEPKRFLDWADRQQFGFYFDQAAGTGCPNVPVY